MSFTSLGLLIIGISLCALYCLIKLRARGISRQAPDEEAVQENVEIVGAAITEVRSSRWGQLDGIVQFSSSNDSISRLARDPPPVYEKDVPEDQVQIPMPTESRPTLLIESTNDSVPRYSTLSLHHVSQSNLTERANMSRRPDTIGEESDAVALKGELNGQDAGRTDQTILDLGMSPGGPLAMSSAIRSSISFHTVKSGVSQDEYAPVLPVTPYSMSNSRSQLNN
jgi:hypothetical protein